MVGESAVAVFNPAAVAVYRDKPHGSPRNTVEVTVAELDSRGAVIRVRADEQPDGAPGLAADITAESAAELRLAPGDRVYFSVKAQEVDRPSEPVTDSGRDDQRSEATKLHSGRNGSDHPAQRAGASSCQQSRHSAAFSSFFGLQQSLS